MVPTQDGGEFQIVNGQAALDDTPRTAIYLSLFGGHIDDSGDDSDNRKQWWGNFAATDALSVYRSRTQYILNKFSGTIENLNKLREAVTLDVEWLRSEFDDITVSCSMPAINSVKITVNVTVDGVTTPYFFTRQWTR